MPSSDGVDFYLSGDNGATWSAATPAFRGNTITGSAVAFVYTVPTQYLTSSFKLKFSLVGC